MFNNPMLNQVRGTDGKGFPCQLSDISFLSVVKYTSKTCFSILEMERGPRLKNWNIGNCWQLFFCRVQYLLKQIFDLLRVHFLNLQSVVRLSLRAFKDEQIPV